jgi:hypothetical protein
MSATTRGLGVYLVALAAACGSGGGAGGGGGGGGGGGSTGVTISCLKDTADDATASCTELNNVPASFADAYRASSCPSGVVGDGCPRIDEYGRCTSPAQAGELSTSIVYNRPVAYEDAQSAVQGCQAMGYTWTRYIPQPTVTAVPADTATPTTGEVGPEEGGTVTSPDGLETIKVPASAVAAVTQLELHLTEQLAPGGLGLGYRLAPGGTSFTHPASIDIQGTPDELADMSASNMGTATQGSDGTWTLLPPAEDLPPSGGDCLAKVQTRKVTDLSGHARVGRDRLRPDKATVQTCGKLKLQVVSCYRLKANDQVEDPLAALDPNPPQPLAPLTGFTAAQAGLTGKPMCPEADIPKNPEVNATRYTWYVNGVAGGNSTYGYVRSMQPAAWWPAATYSAPTKKPSPATVAVTAEYKRGTCKVQLVSHVTIEGPDCSPTKIVASPRPAVPVPGSLAGRAGALLHRLIDGEAE